MVSPSVGRRKATWSEQPSSRARAPSSLSGAGTIGILTELVEEEGILVFLHVLRGARLVQEERVDPFDVVHLHLGALMGDMRPQGGPTQRPGHVLPWLPPGCGPHHSIPQFFHL